MMPTDANITAISSIGKEQVVNGVFPHLRMGGKIIREAVFDGNFLNFHINPLRQEHFKNISSVSFEKHTTNLSSAF